MRNKIVVLETSDVGARYTGQAILRLGFEPLFLLGGRNQYQADIRSQLMEFDVVECGNTREIDIVVQALADLPAGSIEAVVTLLDSRIAVTQQAAAKLGVKGLDAALYRISEKAVVTALVPEYSPRSTTVTLGDDLSQLLSELSNVRQLIVKPSRGAGALGYGEFNPQRDGANRLQRHMSEQAALRGVDTFLIQERLIGRLASLEGYVLDGVCHFLGFSLRKKVGQTESANLFPADSCLSTAARLAAKQAVTALVERSGFRQGYFHSEFIVDEERARLIDANVGRIAGGAVPEQMAIAFGLDPVDLFVHVIAVGCLGMTQPLQVQAAQETLSVCYGLAGKDKLEGIELPQDWSLRHTQLLDEQTEIPAMGGDNWAWLGLASGPAWQVREQIDQIRIVTSQGHTAPHYLEAGQSLAEW